MTGIQRSIILTAPNGRTTRVSARDQSAVVEVTSAAEARGVWVVSASWSAPRLRGLTRTGPMTHVEGVLTFTIEMTDVGQEFLVISHGGGVLKVEVRLSPKKFSLALYHELLRAYRDLLGVPTAGRRSASGSSDSEGRELIGDELAFELLDGAQQMAVLAGGVRRELAEHERGAGGETGLDARRTLTAWKLNPSWYEVEKSESRGSARVGTRFLKPIRAAKRETLGTNMFLSAAITALTDLSRCMPTDGVGGLTKAVISRTAEGLRAVDQVAPLDSRMAWDILGKARAPANSGALSVLAVRLRRLLTRPENLVPHIGGPIPYFLAGPELVFQAFSSAKVLLALGLSREAVREAMATAGKDAGYQSGPLRIHVDTPSHGLAGWRDSTSHPSGYAPDLVVLHSGTGKTLVIDAKFRREGAGLLPPSGIKDVQAYMHEYGKQTAVITVPATQNDPPMEAVSASGFTIRGVSLTTSLESEALEALSSSLEESWT